MTAALYAPVRHHGFLNFDDHVYLYTNPEVASGLTARAVSWAFTTGHSANWHPVTWLSHLLDVEMFGMNPGPHHLVNVLLHTLNTLLLLWVMYRMTGALGRSAFVAAMFAVHPLHVESVAWAAERKDVLSTLFWLLALLAYIGYVRRPGVSRYVLVALLFALGLMAKPMLVTLPFTLLLLDFWPLGRFSLSDRSALPRLLLEKVPLFTLTAASSAITVLVQQRGGAVHTVASLSLETRLTNAVASYAAYIGKMLWPVDLAILYPLSRFTPSWWPLAALVLVGISVAAILAARRHPYVPVGWFWYLGTLVPVIGLVQVGDQAMADRYTYVPLVGLFVVAAWGALELPVPEWVRRAIPLAAVTVIAACVLLTSSQLPHWKNSTLQWEHTLAVTRDNFVAHNSLGLVLAPQGRTDEAISHYREALRINPRYVEAHFNLGVALEAQGKADEAISHYREALRLNPQYEQGHNNLGILLARQGKLDEAINEFSSVLQLNPMSAFAQNNMANALRDKGRRAEAIPHYAEALRLNPEYADAHFNLAATLTDEKRYGEAIPEYLEALRIKPDYAAAHTWLGFALVNTGKPSEAVPHLKEALRLNPGDGNARRILDSLQKQVPVGPRP